jgi:hypothetical protein
MHNQWSTVAPNRLYVDLDVEDPELEHSLQLFGCELMKHWSQANVIVVDDDRCQRLISSTATTAAAAAATISAFSNGASKTQGKRLAEAATKLRSSSTLAVSNGAAPVPSATLTAQPNTNANAQRPSDNELMELFRLRKAVITSVTGESWWRRA